MDFWDLCWSLSSHLDAVSAMRGACSIGGVVLTYLGLLGCMCSLQPPCWNVWDRIVIRLALVLGRPLWLSPFQPVPPLKNAQAFLAQVFSLFVTFLNPSGLRIQQDKLPSDHTHLAGRLFSCTYRYSGSVCAVSGG